MNHPAEIGQGKIDPPAEPLVDKGDLIDQKNSQSGGKHAEDNFRKI
jgi:hypothetical protein